METHVGAGKRHYPALSSLRKRRKSRDYVDYDYVSKLSPDERAFLNQFTDEYYNANGHRFASPMLDKREMDRKSYMARSDVMNAFDRAHGREPSGGGLEDALLDALDQDRPAGGIRPYPGPATTGVSDLPGSGALATNRPAIETGPELTPHVDGVGLSKPPYLSIDWGVMSKTSHAKKRTVTKTARKVVLAAAPSPSPTGDMFRQTANLLRAGLHAGANAAAVAQAIRLMEDAATAADAGPKPVEAPTNGESI